LFGRLTKSGKGLFGPSTRMEAHGSEGTGQNEMAGVNLAQQVRATIRNERYYRRAHFDRIPSTLRILWDKLFFCPSAPRPVDCTQIHCFTRASQFGEPVFCETCIISMPSSYTGRCSCLWILSSDLSGTTISKGLHHILYCMQFSKFVLFASY
jgi:hypothetical protein